VLALYHPHRLAHCVSHWVSLTVSLTVSALAPVSREGTCDAMGAAGFMPAHDSPQPPATMAQKAPLVTTPAMSVLPIT
jgi:hypothetical protein